MSRRLQALGALLGVAILTLRPAVASATSEFPEVIASFVGADSAPACTICHDNPNGGRGTVTTPFGVYMRSRGLVPYDAGSLETALTAARGEQRDSDGDGLSDFDALMQGLDPNGANGGEAVSYGCSVVQQGPVLNSHAAHFVLMLAFVLWRRRRRGQLGTC